MPFDNSPSNHVDTSLAALIAWLEKQPAEKSYRWHQGDACLLAQWFTSVAGDAVSMVDVGRTTEYQDSQGRIFDGEPFRRVALDGPYTFGAALTRALALRTDATSAPSD